MLAALCEPVALQQGEFISKCLFNLFLMFDRLILLLDRATLALDRLILMLDGLTLDLNGLILLSHPRE